MKLRLLCLLMSAFAMLSMLAYNFSAVNADGVTIYYNITSEEDLAVEVTSGDSEYSGNVMVPESIFYSGKTYTVTSIGNSAFSNCSGLTSVTIPNSVTYIGEEAFAYCRGLTSVTIPESVTSIGNSAFSGCRGLTSVEIPNSVTSIGNYAFSGCYDLTSVNIPDSVTSIGENAFFACKGLTSVEIGNSVTSIGEYAFGRCSSLKSINIPNSVTSIGGGAFYDCLSLTYFDSDLASDDKRCLIIDGILYSFAPAGLSTYSIPNSVTIIGEMAFLECYDLTSVEIPNSVTSIGNCAFCTCYGLTSVNIPNSVTSIGYDAFRLCYSLTSVEIPNSVTSIGDYAFALCSDLESMTVYKSNPTDITIGTDAFNDTPVKSATLHVPHGSKELYANTFPWSAFGTIREIRPHLDLSDGQPYTETSDQQGVDVNYIRKFDNTNWQALYVPFDMSYEEWTPYADIAELYNIRGYDLDNDGSVDDVRIEFNRLKEGSSIKPNIPYVIKAKEAGTFTFECKDKIVLAAPTEEGTVECSSTKFTYGFHGIYEEKTDVYQTGAYFLSGGNFIQAADETVKLAPNRAYLTITPKTGGYNDDATQQQAPKRVILVVDGEEETTGIENIFVTTPQDGIYYDLMGRKMTNPTTGIYIQNGQKIYIK